MKETASVIRKTEDKTAEVSLNRTSACAKCGLCSFNEKGTLTLQVMDEIGVAEGDLVEIYLPESSVIAASILVFILPIIVFFIGYLLRGLLFGSAILAAYLAFLYIFDRKSRMLPKITRVLS